MSWNSVTSYAIKTLYATVQYSLIYFKLHRSQEQPVSRIEMLDTAQVSDETTGEHYFCYVLRCHPSVRARRGSASRRSLDRRRGAADAKSGVAESPADDGVGGGAEIPWVISRRFEDFQQLRAALTLQGRALNNGTERGAAGGTGLRGAGTAAPRGEGGASDAKWLAVTEATEVAFPADASTWRDRLERSLSTEAQLIAVRREAMEMWLSNLLTLCADEPLLTRQAPSMFHGLRCC